MLDAPFTGAPGFYYAILGGTKMKDSKTNYPSPFDDCAVSRQKRMGVLTSEGKADLNTIHTLAHVYAALFFDRLCDSNADMKMCVSICEALTKMLQTGNTRQLLLSGSAMRSVGNQEVIAPYVKEFVRQLSFFIKDLPVGAKP